MSNLSLCRVCLASNIRMQHIANTRYEEIFDKLASRLRTADKRPETICFICYSLLQRCGRFMDMARKADQILTQFSHSGIQLTEETVTILDRKFVHKLSWTPLHYLSINDEAEVQVKVEIKKEPCDSAYNVIKEPVNNNELTKGHVIMEPVNNNELTKEHVIMEPVINKKLPEHEIFLKQEMIGSDVVPSNSILLTGEQVTVKTEQIKQEYDDDYDAEGPQPEETSYEEVSITNPEQTQRTRYSCTYCDKAYYQKCHLSRHLKMHRAGPDGTPARNYTCEICGKTFIQKSTLKKHFLHHTGEKRFACDLCPTRCTQKIDLYRHMRVHNGQKPFTCDICKQMFSRKSNMKLHILTHADSKPFVCHICHSTFSRRYDLNRHTKRKHTGEKPYSCDICDFRSVNASYLKYHMENIHLKQQGEKPISCDKCDFKCSNVNYLKRHDLKKHLSNLPKSKKSKIKRKF